MSFEDGLLKVSVDRDALVKMVTQRVYATSFLKIKSIEYNFCNVAEVKCLYLVTQIAIHQHTIVFYRIDSREKERGINAKLIDFLYEFPLILNHIL